MTNQKTAPSSKRLRAIAEALFVTILWSTSWVLIKLSLADIPPLTFAGLRYTIATIILLPGMYKHKPKISQISRLEWGRLAILGIIFYTLTQGGQFLTLNNLEATTFSLLLNFTTIFVAGIGYFALKETPSSLQWLGISIFLGGVLIFFSPFDASNGSMLGFLIAGITVLSNAIASVLGRSINRDTSIPPLVVTVISMGIGSVILLVIGFIVEGIPSLSLENIGVILWLALINTAFAFTLWKKSLQVLSAVESSIINNTMLIQIALLAWLFLGENPSSLDVVGLAIASLGIFLANFKPRNKRSTK